MTIDHPIRVTFDTADALFKRVYDKCEAFAKQNIRRFGDRDVLQEGAKYHGIWLETQPMGGEMYARRDMTVALNNCRMFMLYQRRDGRMPGMITYNGSVCPSFGFMQGDFFTVPAMRMAAHLNYDRDYLLMLKESLEDFDNYLWSCRDSDGDGCLETWCLWDTGDDNNTRFLANGVHSHLHGAWTGETPPEDYGMLPFASAEYMAYSYAHRSALAEICARLGEKDSAARWQNGAEDVRRRFKEYLWDNEAHYAFDRLKTGEKIPCVSLENIKCMYQGIFDQQMADAFIREWLMNPKAFLTELPLPNIAVGDPLFYLSDTVNNLGSSLTAVKANAGHDMADNSWSGPVEGLSLQRTPDALMRYGHHAEVTLIGRRFLDALKNSDRYVQGYDPFTARPCPGEDGYGPTVLAALEYISLLYGIRPYGDTTAFTAAEGPSFACRQSFMGHEYTLEAEGDIACLTADGYTCTFPRGLRVWTDREGRILRAVNCETHAIEAFDCRLEPNQSLCLTGDTDRPRIEYAGPRL